LFSHRLLADQALTSLKIGHPTILINNAGVVQGKLLLDLTETEIKK